MAESIVRSLIRDLRTDDAVRIDNFSVGNSNQDVTLKAGSFYRVCASGGAAHSFRVRCPSGSVEFVNWNFVASGHLEFKAPHLADGADPVFNIEAYTAGPFEITVYEIL